MTKKKKKPFQQLWVDEWAVVWSEIQKTWSVDDWLTRRVITEEERKSFPEAEKAHRIKNSKLVKALK